MRRKAIGLILLFVLLIGCTVQQPTETEVKYTVEDLYAVAPQNCPSCGSRLVGVQADGSCFCGECGYFWIPANQDELLIILKDLDWAVIP